MSKANLPSCWMCGARSDNTKSSETTLTERGRCVDKAKCDARCVRTLMLYRIFGRALGAYGYGRFYGGNIKATYER